MNPDTRLPVEPPVRPGVLRRHADRVIAVCLFFATVAWLLAVEGGQGVGRDEAQYMRAGERYWGWFAELADNAKVGQLRASFTRAGLDRYWGDNAPDHPVVMKVLYGVSWRLFRGSEDPDGARLHPIPPASTQGALPIFSRPSTAFRFPAIVAAGLMAALVFFFARRFVGRPAATAASALAIAQPHYFFHAPIACFDAPITTMAVALAFAYWKSLRSRRWGILTGVVFGIALGVKHNAWLMPIFLLGHYLWMRRQDLRRWRLPPVPLSFISMVVLGPLIFLAHWPWLWSDPVGRTRTYVLRHLQHEHYNFEYLGRSWNDPPTDLDLKLLRMSFPWVSTAVTLPVTTMALAAAGAVVLTRRRRRGQPDESFAEATEQVTDKGTEDRMSDQNQVSIQEGDVVPAPPVPSSWTRPGVGLDRAPGMFFVVQILGPLAVLTVPASPIFGGVKHFMPAFPFVAILAGIGLSWLITRTQFVLRGRLRPAALRVVPVALAILLALPAVAETRRSHPDGLSHYNLLAGGFAGGASLGMNRQFWGYSVLPMLDWMAANAPERRNTYWHDVLGDAINIYVRDGRLPPGMGNTGVGEDAIRRSDMGIIVHEQHMLLYEAVFWESYQTTQPAYVRTREGVPLVTVYKRPGAGFRDLR